MGKGKLSEKELDEVHNAIFVFIFLINLLIGQGCPGGSVGQSGQRVKGYAKGVRWVKGEA